MRMRASRTLSVTLPRAWIRVSKASITPSSASIGTRPVIARSRVDLPEPDGPIRAIISPRRTDTETPSKARCSPKVLEIPRTDRTAASEVMV